jgi:plasmid stabilization system protein ParE
MAEPIITAAAEADYLEGFLWYVERSAGVAERFEAEFARALAEIGASPHRFAGCGDNRHRRFLLRRYPYQVVYRVEVDRPVIIAVAHAKRKPLYWRDR